MNAPEPADRPAVAIRIGKAELIIRQRYEAVSIINDGLIAVWFLTGSVMFFYASWVTTGTWFFVLGSVELLIRPVIRLTRLMHLQRIGEGSAAVDGSQGY